MTDAPINPLNHSMLIGQVSSITGMPKTQVKAVVTAYLDQVALGLIGGAKVRTPLGIFGVKDTAARVGSVFGQKCQIPAGSKVVFKAASQLRREVKA